MGPITATRQERFVELVTSLWPMWGERQSSQSLQGAWYALRGHDERDVEQALLRFQRDNPDATKPTWKTIIERVKTVAVSDRDDLDILLRNHRRLIEHARKEHPKLWAGHMPTDAMSDADVFSHYLHGLVRPTLYDMAGERKTDDMERREKLANAMMRENEIARWCRYFEERGGSAPSWMEAMR